MKQKTVKIEKLKDDIKIGGAAYVRNLAAAEDAVMKGQFNLAKVLRAAAHSQRIIAMTIARLYPYKGDHLDLLHIILSEVQDQKGTGFFRDGPQEEIPESEELHRLVKVRERLSDILQRAAAGLENNGEITDADVAQFLWGCYGCGYLMEGDSSDTCPLCGALSAEFEWFGPFYSSTPEHLGQLSPEKIIQTLESIPEKVASVLSGVDDEILVRKSSSEKWCVKEVVGHIIETDKAFVQRVESILQSQGVAAIPRAKPPWKLHEGKGYETQSSYELINLLRQVRATSLELVKSLKQESWIRKGTVMGKTVSILDLGTWLANHDQGHLAQIRNLCNAS
jgi:rubrerythrin